MKLGIHAYAWCSQWTNEELYLIDRVKEMGLDFLEIPLMVLETFDAPAIKKRLDRVDLEGTVGAARLQLVGGSGGLRHGCRKQQRGGQRRGGNQ